ncbi:MAG: acetyl-coenzyme A synthetase N-terminal domain-containing protein, partial [Myxococcota bacterium]
MESVVAEGRELYTPSARRIAAARMTAFAEWASSHHDAPVGTDYAALWRWSVRDPNRFWRAIWDWFEVIGEGSPERALSEATMPATQWFPHVALNYTENIFRHRGEAL